MKKLALILIFFAFFGFLAFADTGEQEEIGYLLFALNSSSQFENHGQATIQLDSIANYLASKNVYPGQILVYGYSAAAANDIDSEILSRDRALLVINELQKRGVSRELFSEPVGYGSVDLWGSNISENDKIPNRRVRIVLDGNIITPETPQVIVSYTETSNADEQGVVMQRDFQENSKTKRGFKFPWWLILLVLLAIIAALLLFSLLKKTKTQKAGTATKPKVTIVPLAALAINSEIVVNLEEEIRNRAYELYQQRNGQNEDADADWHIAVPEVCARYEADGYKTYPADGSWWARR